MVQSSKAGRGGSWWDEYIRSGLHHTHAITACVPVVTNEITLAHSRSSTGINIMMMYVRYDDDDATV